MAYLLDVRDYLECPICQDTDKDLYLIHCQHSLCLSCIETLQNNGQGGIFDCPECREQQTVPKEGFRKNRLANNLREAIEIKAVNCSKSNCSLVSHTFPVQPVEAICLRCTCLMCAKCALRSNGCALEDKHEVVLLEDAESQMLKEVQIMKEEIRIHLDEALQLHQYLLAELQIAENNVNALTAKIEEFDSIILNKDLQRWARLTFKVQSGNTQPTAAPARDGPVKVVNIPVVAKGAASAGAPLAASEQNAAICSNGQGQGYQSGQVSGNQRKGHQAQQGSIGTSKGHQGGQGQQMPRTQDNVQQVQQGGRVSGQGQYYTQGALGGDDNWRNAQKDGRYHFFFSEKSPLSPQHVHPFQVGERLYNCVEQYVAQQKAALAGDKDKEEAIMILDIPKQQVNLAKKVKVDAKLWEEKHAGLMKTAFEHKFKQIDECLVQLLATGDKIIVFASPYDKVFGIGLAEDKPDVWVKDKWQGKNKLGEILMQIRADLN